MMPDNIYWDVQIKSSLERKLMLSGFLDVQTSEAGQSIGVCPFVSVFPCYYDVYMSPSFFHLMVSNRLIS